MGKNSKLVIIKLGGSVITNKDKPVSPNRRNIRLICRELSRAMLSDSKLRLILIHGGGSFGHYYAKKFKLGTNMTSSASPEGLARTAAAMIDLHSILLGELCRAGVYCGTILPIELFSGTDNFSISLGGKNRVTSIFRNGLVPITFGYVTLIGNQASIISGDKIALALVRAFSVEKTVFVMDVDGVFPSSDLKGPVLEQLFPAQHAIQSSIKQYDVTGGIKAKISAGFGLAKLGTDVYFVNGTKSGRLFKILQGSDDVVATRIYSTKRGRFRSPK